MASLAPDGDAGAGVSSYGLGARIPKLDRGRRNLAGGEVVVISKPRPAWVYGADRHLGPNRRGARKCDDSQRGTRYFRGRGGAVWVGTQADRRR
jgi:hypothetical protein